MMDTPPTPSAAPTHPADSDTLKVVDLETPVSRDGGDLHWLRLRKPKSGDLRGVSIAKLGQLDYDELRKVLPRVSLDGLIAEEVDRIELPDMMEIAGAVADFLFSEKQQAKATQ